MQNRAAQITPRAFSRVMRQPSTIGPRRKSKADGFFFTRNNRSRKRRAKMMEGPLSPTCPWRVVQAAPAFEFPNPRAAAPVGAASGFTLSMPARLGETDLIARYFAPLAGPAGLGLRDDA